MLALPKLALDDVVDPSPALNHDTVDEALDCSAWAWALIVLASMVRRENVDPVLDNVGALPSLEGVVPRQLVL